MKNLFRKTSLTSLTANAAALPSHRGQVAWSLCVAVVVAIVALQQAVGSRRLQQRSLSAQTSATHAPGKPVPLSQEDFRSTEGNWPL